MRDFEHPMLLRIYTDQNARHGDEAVVDLIVRRARRAGLAGATVLRGRVGFGCRAAPIHEHHTFGLDDNLPLVIEAVDEEAALRAFVHTIADLHHIGLTTLERVEVIRTNDSKSSVQ